ncbi:YndJ family protein [Bacillus sp. B-jedd]|uniref:YndJ family protein n=1 Tax=Bacillus sp. B-jedd TaxID=1476857 RepID=UPI00051571CC|nr:YndJ family protein [Bacillus sp. B-jedd]CEG28909.1 membrane protein [Bacillus sp. B-jedd]
MDSYHILQLILILSITLYIPVYFRLAGGRSRFFLFLKKAHPVFAAAAIISFLVPSLSFAWLLYCALIGVYGALRFFERGGFYLEETLIDFSMIYLPIGGVWFVVAQQGWALFGFSGTLALLTAIHFHYSSLFALLFAGLLGRWLKDNGGISKQYHLTMVVLLLSPLAVAIGITYSRVIEIATVLAFAAALYTYCWYSFKTKHVPLMVSSGSLMFTMLLSALYALRLVDIPFMAAFHGITNALLFTGFGLAGWLQLKPQSHFPLKEIPFSSIMGQGRIGTDFFSRNALIANTARHPAGMVDSMADFTRNEFFPGKISPLIADFYTNTIGYDMDVQPRWNPLFYPVARLYKKLSIIIEQMNFPTLKEEALTEVDSRMFKLIDRKDSRENVRAWVRSDKMTSKAIYVAAYSTHLNASGERFYNVFFPLPSGGMTSILRIGHYGKDGVTLTSFSEKKKDDHNGVYLTLWQKSFRIPINETIDVWMEHGIIKAYHASYLFGIRVLDLNYEIRSKAAAETKTI